VKIFLTMLAKQDRDHVVRASAYNIGKWSRKGEKVVLDALAILAAPDTKRLEPQPFDGRRIEKREDGWFIFNAQKYQDEMVKMFQRAKNAQSMREARERERQERMRGHGPDAESPEDLYPEMPERDPETTLGVNKSLPAAMNDARKNPSEFYTPSYEP